MDSINSIQSISKQVQSRGFGSVEISKFESEGVYIDDMEQLKKWFLKEGRNLPWRHARTPYRVWISEVMLQQTQVAVVIPYFARWLQKFPTLESLAKASIEEVMKMWEGLGYYSRVRNLHAAARFITEELKGKIPSTADELGKLPGFGPYTVGAVLSFAFHQKAVAVDGNVIRVLSRYFASSEPCSKRSYYEKLASSMLSEKTPWVMMEALIELGAQICKRKPECAKCPILKGCKAYREGSTSNFPIRSKRLDTVLLKRDVAVIQSGTFFLVRQEKGKKVMSGLYEFPYSQAGEPLSLSLPLKKVKELPLIKHSFTRYEAHLFPSLYKTDQCDFVPGYEWLALETLQALPFSSGHRRILEMLVL